LESFHIWRFGTGVTLIIGWCLWLQTVVPVPESAASNSEVCTSRGVTWADFCYINRWLLSC
jgi:hypothetical protein